MKYFFTYFLFCFLLSSCVTCFFVAIRKVKISLLLFCFLLSSCVTPITLHEKSLNESSPRPTKKVEKTINSFLFGFVNTSEKIKAWKTCHNEWQSIKISRSFLHIFVAGLTLGLYTPFKLVITCSTGAKSDLDDFKQFNIEEEEDEDMLKKQTNGFIKENLKFTEEEEEDMLEE